MSTTPRLVLPVLEASQAQKHVTMNEALLRLDETVQLAVADRDLAAPPADPATGSRYLVAAGASGAWAGGEGAVACERDGVWDILKPRAGWLCWVEDEACLLIHDGASWRDAADAAGWLKASALADGSIARLGVATTPDATNRFAVKADAALFAGDAVAGSGDMRLCLDKTAAGRDAALLFETGWSGRALLGLLGDDDFSIKVSADGASWTEALRIAAATGRIGLPTGALAGGGRLLSTRLFTASGTWTKPTGVRFALVWALGGGGGGGGAAGVASAGAAGGGGGAGGFAMRLLDVSAVSSRAVAIGAGGGGGAASGAAGGTGGATSFGADVVVQGGAGGSGMAAGSFATAVTGGLGGTATAGDPAFAGAPGDAGLRFDAANVLSGSGAASFFGGGARGNVGAVAGSIASAPGSGGSGAAVAASATGLAGGSGAAGLIWIWEFE
ncbi:MAG: DUF2793 domain-containing protein [Hyphomicrobiales bacterium]|nr:DUF2793 domain-containing protein [Hyphomicrobiales bacterium]